MKPRPLTDGRTGSALIITLIFLTLIAIVILGFMASMKLEVISSNSHLKGAMAETYAQTGLDAGVARLQAAWEAVPATNGYAASGPGWFFVSDANSPAATNAIRYDLSTGFALESALPDEAANLNAPPPGSAQGRIAVTNAPMRVRWMYLLKDGTLSTNSPPAYNAANPAVGRFAFWIDDETAKINANTAFTRNTNSPSGRPSQVNLEVLFPGDSTTIASYRTNNHFFDTPADIRQVSANIAASAQTNAFGLTHYNHAPDLTVFGEPRIVLTTQKNLADGGEFLDILTTDNTDPGTVGSLSATKLDAAIKRLAGLLNRTDWPLVPGKSFAAKFGPTALPVAQRIRPEQLAIDIIEYVRARESSVALVEPIRGNLNAVGDFAFAVPTGSANIMGNNRGVKITEFGFYLTPGSAPKQYKVHMVLEIHLPQYAGLTSVDLSALYIHYSMSPDIIWTYMGSGSVFGTHKMDGTEAVVAGNPLINAGEYRKITFQAPSEVTINSPFTPANITKTYPSLALSVGGLLTSQRIEKLLPGVYFPNSSTVMGPEANINSTASEDPYNRAINNWTKQLPVGVSWGSANPSTLGTASSTNPQQDTDATGKITDAGLRFPPPKGQTGNLKGIMESVAELGFVHTGYESPPTLIVAGSNILGTPWRSLRLQPKNDAAATLPDWALLDLFRVPASSTPSFHERPHHQSGGRVNINAAIQPFLDAANNPALARPLPLQALLQGARTTNSATTLSTTNAQTLAENILNRTPATGANAGQNYGFTNFYLSSGQLAEIEGIADQGEASETLLRDIVDLAATRGNVHAIHAIGQSILQTSSGIQVQGERQSVIMVERDGSATPVKWRTVFSARH